MIFYQRINNRFATVSEALYIAERKATEDLKLRNDIRKKIALKEKLIITKDKKKIARQ